MTGKTINMGIDASAFAASFVTPMASCTRLRKTIITQKYRNETPSYNQVSEWAIE